MFFDEYTRFTETSHTAAGINRLNLRHEAIIGPNKDILSGARVLDIASHDGRWSLAASKAGAKHVIGVEARRPLVRKAEKSFAHYDADPESYEFITGDVFEVLHKPSFEVDVVMCLGFLYHTWRLTELLSDIRSLNAEYLILDTQVLPQVRGPVVQVGLDAPQAQGSAVLDTYGHEKTVTGRPSVPALQLLLETYGFGIEEIYDWHAALEPLPRYEDVGDYRQGGRVTMRCRTGVPSLPDVYDRVYPPKHQDGRTTTSKKSGVRSLVNQTLERVSGYRLTRAPSRD